MPFSIVGLAPHGVQHATRIRAASAVVLASRWENAGLQGVTIKEGDFQPEPVEKFRRRQYGPFPFGLRVASPSRVSA